MNHANVNSITLHNSSELEVRGNIVRLLFNKTTVILALAVLLLSVGILHSANNSQYAGSAAVSTAELKCNDSANRTGYALGCKPNS